jgi:transcriptional regulator with XRE-family HTH domain
MRSQSVVDSAVLPGAEVRALRDLASYSLDQVCDGCGRVFDVPQLSRFERNQLSLPADQIDLIKRVLRAEIRARRREINVALRSVADGRSKRRDAERIAV